jgi:hypothetical protein
METKKMRIKSICSLFNQSIFTLVALFSIYQTPVYSGALDLSYLFNGSFTEDFDGMGTGTSAPGTIGPNSPWSVKTDTEKFNLLNVANSPTDSGGSNTGYNAGLNADRALGIYRDQPPHVGYMIARFKNNTGQSLTKMSLLFDVELQYEEDPDQPRWGGAQGYISNDNITYYDLGSLFEGTVTGNENNPAEEWVSDDDAGNANRNIGGSINLATILGSGIAQGSDFYLKFDLANGLTTPDGYGDGNNKRTAIFVDNLRLVDESAPAIPEPSTYLILTTFMIIIWLKRHRDQAILLALKTKEQRSRPPVDTDDRHPL